ncbi:Gamma-glutamyltransferase [Cyberlindnera fabianii]|uniref:Glutathione hydrolase n=1 Tax=Cyberlindnera fabianii TaxID=36022 RepID=A0A1V2L6P5_CYBFA|nr:Gamma-glutamyltransferase [Cyberlindnera fabianii]
MANQNWHLHNGATRLGAIIFISLVIYSSLVALKPSSLNFTETQLDGFYTISKDRGIDISPLLREPDLDPDPRHLHSSPLGAVACDVPHCSKLGASILEKGGNAADAAVTVALCVGGTNMFNSGIGGGGFIVSKKFKEDAISIDAREMAPIRSHKYMYKGREYLSKVSGLAAAIPGELKGLYTLFESQGSGVLSWSDVIMPVVDLMRGGWNTSIVLSAAVAADKHIFEKDYQTWNFLFRDNSTTEVIRQGDRIRQTALADTLELIAKNGSDAIFYDPHGPIASHLIRTIQRNGGIFTNEDFEMYNVSITRALHTEFLGNDVFTCAGSCSGPAMITGLKIMNSYGVHEGGDMEPVATHRLVESMKWIASSRSRLGDQTNNMIEFVTSDDWAEYARKHIDDNKTLNHWSEYKPAYEVTNPHGTTSFSIVDRNHNAVAMTSTINLLFGCLVRDSTTGIILNNEMDDFSTPGVPNAFGVEPSVYNFINPRKRPLSSSVPTIVVNELKRPDLIIGAAGGSRITTAVFQAIVRVYSYNMPILETLSYPRMHHQLLPDTIEHEVHIGSDITEALQARGHNMTVSIPKTAMNAIRRWRAQYHAVSDYWRKRGEAAVPNK